MNRKPPPPPPKGTRHPGSGRMKGTPNKISVEARTLVAQLVNDVSYQFRLRRDFRRRKVHPTIESLIWTYHLGKPTQPIAMSGSLELDVHAKLEEERRVFATLDIADLEQLAAESQALVDRAFKLAKIASSEGQVPQDVVVSPLSGEVGAESLAILSESDKGDYGYPNPESPNSANSIPDNALPDSDDDTPSDTK
jgi:hypothetical protein